MRVGLINSFVLIFRHFAPPKNPGLDDETNEPLIRRPDDEPETVRSRLAVCKTSLWKSILFVLIVQFR